MNRHHHHRHHHRRRRRRLRRCNMRSPRFSPAVALPLRRRLLPLRLCARIPTPYMQTRRIMMKTMMRRIRARPTNGLGSQVRPHRPHHHRQQHCSPPHHPPWPLRTSGHWLPTRPPMMPTMSISSRATSSTMARWWRRHSMRIVRPITVASTMAAAAAAPTVAAAQATALHPPDERHGCLACRLPVRLWPP